MRDSFIKASYKKLLIGIFVLTLAVLAFLVLFFGEKMEDHMVAKLSDTLNESVRAEMARQIEQTRYLALAISSNELLAKALENRDRKKASYIIDTVMAQFDGYADTNKFWVQLHTPDLRVFLRSWDRVDFGAPLEGFRKGLTHVRATERPFASVELGKKLNIKAIAPMKIHGEYVGSLEVIRNFDESIEAFKQRKISLFVLMDKRYLGVASWMTDYPMLGDFVLCHRVYDEELFDELKKEDLYSFIGKRNSFTKNYFLSFEPLRDLSGERLGFFVSAIPKERALALLKNKDDISLLTTASRDKLGQDYKTKAKIGGSLDADTKKIYQLEDKKEKLKAMSKEELENILLYGEDNEIKKGEVR